MTDTIRTVLYLQNVLRDGQPDGTIVPQMIRDFVVSALSTTAGVTAAGQNQAAATVLPAIYNIVTAVSSGQGVILTTGIRTVVMNRGANILKIYPPVGSQLESLGTNNPFSLQPGADATIVFDPSNPSNGYVSVFTNIYSLPTTEPSTSGVVWNDGGMIAVS